MVDVLVAWFLLSWLFYISLTLSLSFCCCPYRIFTDGTDVFVASQGCPLDLDSLCVSFYLHIRLSIDFVAVSMVACTLLPVCYC
jgi:hypothetical protein